MIPSHENIILLKYLELHLKLTTSKLTTQPKVCYCVWGNISKGRMKDVFRTDLLWSRELRDLDYMDGKVRMCIENLLKDTV